MANFSRILNPDAAAPAPKPLVSYTPTAQPSTRAQVGVALSSAAVTTGVVMILPWILVLKYDPRQSSVIVTGFVTWLVFMGAWFYYSESYRRTLWKIEEWTGVELTGDKVRGEPYATHVHTMADSRPVRPPEPGDILAARFSRYLDDCYRVGAQDEYPSVERMVKEGWKNKKEQQRFREEAARAGIFTVDPNNHQIQPGKNMTRARAREVEKTIFWSV